MRFEYHEVSHLPRLAWAAVLRRDEETIDLYHGEWVERLPAGFCEGVWDGSFEAGHFVDAVTFMGSGGKIRGDTVVFSTPTHMYERLFSVENDGGLFVSNSLAFVLSISGTAIDINHIAYQGEYDTIYHGHPHCIKSSPLKNNKRVTYHLFSNVEIDRDFNVRIIAKPIPPPFEDFDHYETFLLSTLETLFENGASEMRKRQYTPLSTASSGYDSAACAALARDCGCDAVFTFKNARPEHQIFGVYTHHYKPLDDSGENVAKALGYENILVRDRWAYLEGGTNALLEAEACAAGHLWYDPVVKFEEDIEQKILLTGQYGDATWSLDAESGVLLDKSFGSSLQESRLRIGFIHTLVPAIGSAQRDAILAISHSAEMRPWRLFNDYDRPIPRRLLEKRGVPRESFGMQKKAVGVVFAGTKNNILSQMSDDSVNAFVRFYKSNRWKRNPFKQWYYDCLTFLYLLPRMIELASKKISVPVDLSRFRKYRHRAWAVHKASPRTASYLLPWGVTELMPRYRIEKK